MQRQDIINYKHLEPWKGKIVVVDHPRVPWKKQREKYLYNGKITNQRLREVLPNEIIIEFDFVKEVTESEWPTFRDQAVKVIEAIKKNMIDKRMFFWITDHKGKSPHIRFIVEGLEEYGYDERKVYKTWIARELKKGIFALQNNVELDESLFGVHLVSLENQPHFKEEYGGQKEEVIFVHEEGKIPKVNPEHIKSAVQEIKKSERLNLGETLEESIEQGERNNMLFKMACSLRHKHVNKETLRFILHDKNKRDCKPPLPDQDVDVILDQAFSYKGPDNYEDFSNNEERFTQYSGTELLLGDFPEPEYILKDMVPKKGITIIGGDSGTGKSYKALHFALAAITATPYLNHFHLNFEGTVLFIDEENAAPYVADRVRKLMHHKHMRGIENLHYFFNTDIKLDVDNDKGDFQQTKILKDRLARIELEIEKVKPSLIVLDSFIRMFQGDENFSSDVRRVFETLKKWYQRYDCAIIVLHHTPKPKNGIKQSLRGSGDIKAMADSVLMMEKGKVGEINVIQEKHRHGEEVDPFKFKMELDEGDNMRLDYAGNSQTISVIDDCRDKIMSWIMDNNIGSFETKEVYSGLETYKYKRDTVQAALKQLLGRGYLNKPRRGKYEVLQNGQNTLHVSEEGVK